jgi:hypothetical protein
MRVLRRALPYLAGKSLAQKVKFVKQTALYNRSAGAVFVIDTEGEHPGKKRAELEKGRDSAYPDFPTPISTAGKLIILFGFLARDFMRICCCEPPGD